MDRATAFCAPARRARSTVAPHQPRRRAARRQGHLASSFAAPAAARTRLPADEPLPAPPGSQGAGASRPPGDALRPRWAPGYSAEARARRAGRTAREVRAARSTHDANGEADARRCRQLAARRLSRALRDAPTTSAPTSRPSRTSGGPGRDERRRWRCRRCSLVESGTRARSAARRASSSTPASPTRPLTSSATAPASCSERRRLGRAASADRDSRSTRGRPRRLRRDAHRRARPPAHAPAASGVRAVGRQGARASRFATFRDKLRPGHEGDLARHGQGPDGADRSRAGAAEMLAYMYDRSLDFFAPPLAAVAARRCTRRAAARRGCASTCAERRDPVASTTTTSRTSRRAVAARRLAAVIRRLRHRRHGRSRYRNAPGARPCRRRCRPRWLPPPRRPPPPQTHRVQAVAARGAPRVERQGRGAQAMADNDKRQLPPRRRKLGRHARRHAAAHQLRRDRVLRAARSLTDKPTARPTIEFTVPDSVTRGTCGCTPSPATCASGSQASETRSVKELMVRPYLPRFLREGDQADAEGGGQQRRRAAASRQRRLRRSSIPTRSKSLAAQFGLSAERDKPFTRREGRGRQPDLPGDGAEARSAPRLQGHGHGGRLVRRRAAAAAGAAEPHAPGAVALRHPARQPTRAR